MDISTRPNVHSRHSHSRQPYDMFTYPYCATMEWSNNSCWSALERNRVCFQLEQSVLLVVLLICVNIYIEVGKKWFADEISVLIKMPEIRCG